MCLASVNHHKSFARSLSAIHQQPGGDSDSDGSNINVRQDRKATRRKSSSPRCNRRSSIETITPPRAPAPRAGAPSVSFSSEEMPDLPIFTNEQEQQPRKLQRRRRSTATVNVTLEQRRERRNMTKARILEEQPNEFSRDYELGETVRCPSHMITEEIDSLEKHDFAFVRRSDGSYSYAILAQRTDECMVFVMDSTGATKRISKKHWVKLVRRSSR